MDNMRFFVSKNLDLLGLCGDQMSAKFQMWAVGSLENTLRSPVFSVSPHFSPSALAIASSAKGAMTR